MYILKAATGGFLYPSKESDNDTLQYIGKLNGYGGSIKTLTLPIPQDEKSFSDFIKVMAERESSVKDELKKLGNANS